MSREFDILKLDAAIDLLDSLPVSHEAEETTSDILLKMRLDRPSVKYAGDANYKYNVGKNWLCFADGWLYFVNEETGRFGKSEISSSGGFSIQYDNPGSSAEMDSLRFFMRICISDKILLSSSFLDINNKHYECLLIDDALRIFIEPKMLDMVLIDGIDVYAIPFENYESWAFRLAQSCGYTLEDTLKYLNAIDAYKEVTTKDNYLAILNAYAIEMRKRLSMQRELL